MRLRRAAPETIASCVILISCYFLFLAPAVRAAGFDELLRDELRARAGRLSDPAAHDSILAAFSEAGPAGSEVALELLRSDVGDRAPRAARLLSELGGSEAVGGLLACAASHASETVSEACEDLVDEDAGAARRIARAESREQVLEELGALKLEPRVKVALLEQLALQTDPRRAEILAVALANLHDPAVAPALRRLAEHLPEARATRLREWADALQPREAGSRSGCARILSESVLEPRFRRSDRRYTEFPPRLGRALLLEQQGDVRDLAELHRLLADSNRDVKLAAARGLAKIGDPAAIPVLIEAIPGPDPRIGTGDLVFVGMTLAALADIAGRDVASAHAGDVPATQAAWRAWWESERESFDALAMHVRSLSDRSATPSFSILGRAGTLETARAILACELGDDAMVAEALCRISARHAGVLELVRAQAPSSARWLRVLRHLDAPGARDVALALVARGDADGIERAQEACASWVGGCDAVIVDAVVARLPELAAQAVPEWRLRLPLARTHCPALRRAAGAARDARLGSELSSIARRLECDRPGLLITTQADGSVALQRCDGRCEDAASLVGRPAIIADWSDEASPRTRHGMACASAELLGVRTSVGLVLALRSDDPFARRLSAQALSDLAELSGELAPECVTPSDPRGAAIFDAPFLRAQLEETAAGPDPDAAEPARRLLSARR